MTDQDYDFSFMHHTSLVDPRYRFGGYHIISDQISREGIGVVWKELETILRRQTPGDIVEFGCYIGTSSLFIRRQLDNFKQSDIRAFHVYDSFAGLPKKAAQDVNAATVDFTEGKLRASKREFIKNFQAASLRMPVIHKGWFSDLTGQDVPEKIAFAFLDGDFYDSILDSLKLVWPRMQPDGKVLIDDYQRPELPGVERAVRDFFQGKTMPRLRVSHNIAIIEL